jgi:predicted Zn-dependent peptidase
MVNFKRKVLKNGLTILFEERELPVVSVGIGVRSGAISEKEEEKGISHFIEHLLYKGTSNRSQFDISLEIERHGGILDGFTSETVVGYWAKIPSSKLNIALDVLFDIVKNPLFEEKEIEKERDVIIEEMKMHRDNPRMHILHSIPSLLYKNPAGLPMIGSLESLKNINRKKILRKFSELYVPKNLILCVVGKANFESLVRFAEKNFSFKEGALPRVKIEEKLQNKREKRKGLDQANLVFAYPVPKIEDRKHYAAEVLIALLAGGMSSRLFIEIREKRNLAYAVSGGSDITKDFAYNFIWVGAKKENMNLVKKLIQEELDKVSSDLKEDELRRIKEQLIGNKEISMEDSQEQMVGLLFSEVQGRAEEFYEFKKNIQKVSLKDVKEIAKNASKKFAYYILEPEN